MHWNAHTTRYGRIHLKGLILPPLGACPELNLVEDIIARGGVGARKRGFYPMLSPKGK